ncbi:MAG: sigma-70 family RNA polymerase sigma factor [Opitutales bacterium]|nr:sigma-70 family RNA polymerase sigma factor [Opitutales bacterium]
MKCPDTPKSVISQMLNREQGVVWQQAWSVFFDIYYQTMHSMAVNVFKYIGWSGVSDEDIQDIISASVISVIKTFEEGKYEKGKYRFRGFLKQVITRRVIDYIRNKNKKRSVSIEIIDLMEDMVKHEHGVELSNSPFDKLESDEADEYRKSVIMDAWESVRISCSPQSCLIFELSQLEGKKPTEIAEMLGVSRNVIDTCVHRVLKKLRAKLEEENYRKELEK